VSIEQELEQFFKPETRKAGANYFAKNSVIISNKSDTHVQGYIKGTSSARVSLSSSSIESHSFTADCSCPASNKGQLCKHIWAVVLMAEKLTLDFLCSKTTIEKISKPNPKQDAYKERQSDYRKLQYQKQKLNAKKLKLAKEKQKFQDEQPKLPDSIEKALAFFSENGFPIERPIKEEDINNARKKLARIFHPDVGGSHQETVTLNEYYNILINYLN
jgi:uncharacterized Zn finger protein